MTEPGGAPDECARASRRRAALWLLPLLLTPLLIAQCATAPFLAFDDATYIRDDPRLSAEAPLHASLTHRPYYPFYYPATMLSWKLDRLVWGNLLATPLGERAWPTGIRITNLLLHLGAALLLWSALRALRAPDALAGFVTAAFALHPAACESVCWAVERKNVLAAFFAFAALLLYIRARGLPRHAGAVALFALAILSKPSALGLFAVVASWELLGRPSFGSEAAPRDRWTSALARLAPWTVVAAAGTALGFVMHEENLLPPPGGNVFTALLTDVEILWRYALHFLWPAGLSAYYCVVPIVSLAEPRLWTHGLPLLLLVASTVLVHEKGARRPTLFAWLWFFGALGTNLNLVGINDLMHDRFVYLSSPGFWLALGLAAGALAKKAKGAGVPAWAPAAAVVGLSLAWSGASFVRGERFSLAAKLFEDAVAKQPGSSYARIFLAADYRVLAKHKRKKGEAAEAEDLFARSFASLEAGVRAPDFDRFLQKTRAYADLALEYQRRKRFPQAAEYAQKALASGGHAEAEAAALTVLASQAAGRNELNEALALFDDALKRSPQDRAPHLGRARTLLLIRDHWQAAGDPAKARAAQAEAVASLRALRLEDEGGEEARALLRQIAGPP
ncbi:MAG: tetratricopeptide repeat protein [Planctomycetota bacterium]|nr:tetratricopeptide repeat protein [Planctomycetota bacterium]